VSEAAIIHDLPTGLPETSGGFSATIFRNSCQLSRVVASPGRTRTSCLPDPTICRFRHMRLVLIIQLGAYPDENIVLLPSTISLRSLR